MAAHAELPQNPASVHISTTNPSNNAFDFRFNNDDKKSELSVITKIESADSSYSNAAAAAPPPPSWTFRNALSKEGFQAAARVLIKFAKFTGPGAIISVAYVDPDNFQTAVSSGVEFKYKLLFMVLVANLISIYLQVRMNSIISPPHLLHQNPPSFLCYLFHVPLICFDLFLNTEKCLWIGWVLNRVKDGEIVVGNMHNFPRQLEDSIRGTKSLD